MIDYDNKQPSMARGSHAFEQFRIIMWKNFVIASRNIKMTLGIKIDFTLLHLLLRALMLN